MVIFVCFFSSIREAKLMFFFELAKSSPFFCTKKFQIPSALPKGALQNCVAQIPNVDFEWRHSVFLRFPMALKAIYSVIVLQRAPRGSPCSATRHHRRRNTYTLGLPSAFLFEKAVTMRLFYYSKEPVFRVLRIRVIFVVKRIRVKSEFVHKSFIKVGPVGYVV